MDKKFKKSYMCIGENFLKNRYVKLGYAGDIHSLEDWLKILFYEYDEEQINTYFNDQQVPDLLEYILTVKGKRLVKFGV